MSETAHSPLRGQDYWRSLQELADTDEFRHQLDNEFPGGVDAPGGMTRRRFLQIMSASIALSSLAGCRWPTERIVPFAKRPAGYAPGTPLQFATTFELGPVAHAVLATSYDGRPIKIDGNPEFALSGGATSALAQASVLDLYDPDRSKAVISRRGRSAAETDWATFGEWAAGHFGALRGKGAGLAILTGATSSPSLRGLLEQAGRAFPGSRTYQWEPVCRRNEILGAKAAFGQPARPQLDLERAAVIVDFDANVLQDGATALKCSRQFAKGRKPDQGRMNRLYCWESGYSTTGGMADHRFPTPARDIGPAAWALAAELVLGEGLPLPVGAGLSRGDLSRWRGHAAGGAHLGAVARDLMANRGKSLLVAGLRQPAAVHGLVHTLNTALGNVGTTITFIPMAVPDFGTIEDLVRDLDAGRIDTLVILDGNPVYTAPADLDFPAALGKAAHRIHLGDKDDATGKACTWHLPRAHYLEAWSDATGWDGSYLAVQPLIAPLYDGHTAAELLSLMVDETPRTGWQIARDTFAVMTGGRAPAPPQDTDRAFEQGWQAFVHDGFLQGSGRERGETLALAGGAVAAPAEGAELGPQNLEIVFVHDQSVWDGRFADNAWLQEMPDFMSKLTWDNAALIGPATADALGLKHGDLVELNLGGRTVEAPVYVQPGQARWSVTVSLGYGRTDCGRVGLGAGFDAYRLRTFAARDFAAGLTVGRTGRTHVLATTQDHHAIDQRGAAEVQSRVPRLVREGTLADYEADGHFADHLGIHHPPLLSLWKEKEYTGHKWGMGVDLNACNGCNACLIGCQSENNVPVVGKDEVARGREMSWIRLDRYFLGDPEAPTVTPQPVGCVHCELAPCEQVCPVAATLHTEEGLNAMVYNRCVGTRYCSNNCPYKVRRFNWFNNFEDLTATQRLVLNPDVTVRARGVMEKCTYCVQRIEKARVAARVEGRRIMDGDITPACAQTCPTEAIVFGDLNDPTSRVSRMREDSRAYDLLGYLNVKPRTFYLARLRNPNPEIAPARMHDGHGGGHDQDHAQEAGHGHG
ncbi:MAG: TAT-variant-translocated molybdopterin oxidoreductase [Krumholzibacteria bacterium]|nr:TAT-variant-translocated molybdopterin oxidoreductase [Candidatus Krumholzibacteria bacterium]